VLGPLGSYVGHTKNNKKTKKEVGVAVASVATCMLTANEPLNEYFKITDSRSLADQQNQMKPNQTKPKPTSSTATPTVKTTAIN